MGPGDEDEQDRTTWEPTTPAPRIGDPVGGPGAAAANTDEDPLERTTWEPDVAPPATNPAPTNPAPTRPAPTEPSPVVQEPGRGGGALLLIGGIALAGLVLIALGGTLTLAAVVLLFWLA